MGLEVEAHLFRWLQTAGFVKDGRRTNDNKIELSEQVSMKVYDGVIIGQVLKHYAQHKNNQASIEKLDAIKENSTPAIRLYNWNILTQALKKSGLNLEYSQKSKILNLESQPINKVLAHLYKHQQQQQPTVQASKPLQVDILQVSKKQLRDAANILQFFVISISKNFKLSPQHTLNLFLDNNKYLAHLLVKGVKGSYDPIFAFLSDISQNIDYIVVTLFCIDEKQSLTFFLNGIKPALISKQSMVCQSGINLLSQMYSTYETNYMPTNLVSGWMKQQGINTIFFAIKRHPNLIQQLINITYSFIKSQLFGFIQPIDKSALWENDFQKLQFFSNFLTSLTLQAILSFTQHKSFHQWVKIIIKLMKRAKDINEIFTLINIMEWIWMNLEKEFESNENGLPNAFLAFLKNTSLNNNQLIFTESIRTMFSLMEELGNRKNSYAPFFYKILVSCFSFITDSHRLQFLAINFIEAFKSINNLPGGPLVQPLLKCLEKEITLNCIDLCRNLLQQNRLNEQQLINIIDLLTRIAFQDPQYGDIALQSIFDNLSIMNEDMLEEFLQNNSKNSLAYFFSITKSISRKFSQLRSDFNRYGKDESMKKGGNLFCQQMQKHILLGYLIKFMEKCIQESQQVKQAFQPLLFHTHIRIKDQLSKAQQANLLIPVMKYYYPAQDQLQQKIKAYQFQINPPKPPTPKIKLKSQQSGQNLLKNKSKLNRSMEISEQKTPKYIDSSTLKPSSYALKDLEKVKQKVQNLKTLGERREKEKDFLQQKKQLFRSVLNEKRIIQFGGKGAQNKQYKCLYEWETAKEENPNKVHGIPYIKLLNISSEQETSFAEDADSLIRKYRKVWRFLFFKYSTFGARKQQFKTEEKINIAEIWKMHRQYEAAFLKKEESQAIVRLINENMKRKSDLQNLTYLGFEQYILQVCNYGYSKIGFSHLTPGQKILMFIQQLKLITTEKGGNIELYQNPEQVYFQETEVIKQFNKRLNQNPQYILPEGYKKIVITQLKYDYDIHPANFVGLPEKYMTILEVLDQILFQKKELGFHLIEPLTHKEQRVLAKPSLFQNLNDKMKEYKGGYLQPKKLPSTSNIKERQKKAVGFKRQFHPMAKFSIGIKMGLAGVNIKNRFIADEVAYWMDDMLDAIQKDSNTVENKAKKKIDNEALKKKRASLHKLKQEQQEEEKKWKKRAESVKAKAQVNRQKKKEQDKKSRQARKLMRQAEKQKQIAAMKRKLNQFETAKKKLDEKRKQEEMKRKADLQTKKKNREEYKKGVEEYFQKKKQELQEKQTNMKKIKEEEKVKEKEKEEKKEQFVKKLHYSILKKQENVLQHIQETKKGFDEAWTSEDIQDVIDLFETPLEYLYDLLLKYEKSKISATNSDEISMNTLHFFALKFKIVPFMLEKNSLSKIFKSVGKNSISSIGINFRQFQQTLFRIAVKSKELLNGIIERRKEKQKQMAQFISKKSSDGNHYDVDSEISKVSPSRIIQSPKKVSLTEDYLFNAEGVTGQTIKELLKFLNLPKDRQGVEERYREAIQNRSIKPTNILKRELQDALI